MKNEPGAHLRNPHEESGNAPQQRIMYASNAYILLDKSAHLLSFIFAVLLKSILPACFSRSGGLDV